MQNSLTFLLFDILFGVIPISFLLTRYKKAAWKYRKLIIIAALISIPASLLTDFFGLKWSAWQYSYSKTLNTKFFGTLLEVFIWGTLFMLALALIVAVFAEKEEKKKSFKPFF